MPKLLAVPNIDKFAYLIHEQRKVMFWTVGVIVIGVNISMIRTKCVLLTI